MAITSDRASGSGIHFSHQWTAARIPLSFPAPMSPTARMVVPATIVAPATAVSAQPRVMAVTHAIQALQAILRALSEAHQARLI